MMSNAASLTLRARAYARPIFGSLMTRSGAWPFAGHHLSATLSVPSVEPLSTMITSHRILWSTSCAARCDRVAGSSAAESWQQTTTLTPGLSALKRSPVCRERAVDHCAAAELCGSRAGGGPVRFAPVRVVKQCADCLCQELHVLCVELDTRITEHFSHRRLISRYYAASRAHGLEH